MSEEKGRYPDQPPAYTVPPATTNPNPTPGYGNNNYGFDNLSSGTTGGYHMNNPVGNQGSYGYAPPANSYSSNVVVTQVGQGTGPVYNMPPPDYTTQAWLVCLLCFWPTGLLAILRANESRDCLARGDMMGAHSAANSARQMVRISIIVGILSFVAVAVFVGVYVGVVLNNINNIYDYD